ncbi:hypothetical protein EP56_01715 [Listeriaceae bacterium FSL A5-0209]|nr:hypothetical protein EP56_01715 [Listeriaceae bacterium FSL A5-0209]
MIGSTTIYMTIVFIFMTFAYLLDKFGYRSIFEKYCYFLIKVCVNISITFLMIVFGMELLAAMVPNSHKYLYFHNLPTWMQWAIPIAIITLQFLLRLHQLKRSRDIFSYRNFRRDKKYPEDALHACLLFEQHRKEILSQKISVLKSFSPIPIILLILPNITTLMDALMKPNANISLQNANLVGIVLVLSYTGYFFKVLNDWIACTRSIHTIEEGLLYLKNPDLMEELPSKYQ